MELHLTNLVPDQLIKALCNTLINSLWQGLILAAIAGLTIVLTKKVSAAFRYNLMIGLLVLFSVGITFTFFSQLNFAAATKAPVNISAANTYTYQLTPVTAPQQNTEGVFKNVLSYFNSHSDTIVLTWFLIICGKCIQLAAGLHNIYYIKRAKILAAGNYWEQKVQQLSRQLRIKRTVSLMQSGIAKLPMVLGHFKPVVLIPIGLLTALTTEEVEAILIHELAHVRRRDYLVNLLQNLLEIVFFFNPAVLWVSFLIKAERENCCDDIVLAQTSSKVSYIKALVSCQEYQSSIPAYAMGLGGSSDHFLQRVKRMLSNNNQSLNKIEKMVLTICLISAVLLTAAFSKAGKEHDAFKPKTHNSLSFAAKADNITATDSTTKRAMIGDTDVAMRGSLKVYKPNEVAEGSMLRFTKKIKHQLYLTYLVKKEGTLYQYTALDNGGNATYYVNGSALTEDKIAEYKPKFDRLMSEMDRIKSPVAPPQPGQLQHNGGVGEIVDEADSVKQGKINATNYNEDSNWKALAALKANLNGANSNEDLNSMKLKALIDSKAKQEASQGKMNGSLNALDTARAIAAYKYKMMKDSNGKTWRKKPIDAKYVKKYEKSAYKPVGAYKQKALQDPAAVAEPTEPVSPPTVESNVAEPPTPPSPENAVSDKIAKQLIDSHLIKDKGNYSFKINNDELYIDGVKQSDKVHDQVIKSCLKPGDHINLTRTNKTTN